LITTPPRRQKLQKPLHVNLHRNPLVHEDEVRRLRLLVGVVNTREVLDLPLYMWRIEE
jgi:hypothetical protein